MRKVYIFKLLQTEVATRMKYRFGGKEKLLALELYPDVSLAKAREKHNDARKLLADNVEPSEHRKIMKKVDGDRLTNLSYLD